MNPEIYQGLKQRIVAAGYEPDVKWAETVGECANAFDFFVEYTFVVCNSGMKAQIARPIFDKIMAAIRDGKSASEAFGHKGKSAAIDSVFARRDELFAAYKSSADKLAFLESLPWIGPITKFHLAKNFGVQCCKPDRHLVRIASANQTTPEAMCAGLAAQTGDRIGVVDVVIWRAANLGMI